MPCAVDYILEGLAKNLELERELGGFSLEFDREFLAKLPKERAAKPAGTAARAVAETTGTTETAGTSGTTATGVVSKPVEKKLDFVFLHHAAVSGLGVEMMAKIIAAMKKTPETAPIVFTGAKPAAKIYVVLGTKALKQWYDGVSLAYGGWFNDVDSEVLLVYSPEDIYRFGTTLTPAMKQKKLEMWNSLKQVMGKVRSEK